MCGRVAVRWAAVNIDAQCGTVVNMERIMHSPGEAAKITGLSRSTIYRYLGTGQLPSVHIGRRRLIAHKDLLAFLSNPKAGARESS